MALLHCKSLQGSQQSSEGDDEELFLKLVTFPHCVVSNASHELVNLIHQALQVPLVGESRSLYQLKLHKKWDLFRVVYSSHHKHKLADVPQLSMVFHNDCFYVAHCIAIMLQRGDTERILNNLSNGRNDIFTREDTSSFVDLIHSLRELGETSWLHATTKQVEQLQVCIQEMGGLADTQEVKRKPVVEKGFKMISHQLKTIGDTWRGVLASQLYFTTLGILVDSLFSLLIGELEIIEAIAEEESHILHALLLQVLRQSETIFKSAISNTSDRVTQFLVTKYVQLWSKFSKSIDLLEMPLIKIVEYYKNGLLEEFSAKELKRVILCLFSDSPLRKQLLEQLT